jgi:2-iminoacetate synthase
MSTFQNVLDVMDWDQISQAIASKTIHDVDRALGRRSQLDVDDFMALVSPAATTRLEAMASLSRELTMRRFGKTAQLYIPIYLSNECTNQCVYCGFSAENEIARKTLTANEMIQEAELVRSWGFEHVLLVTGEDARQVDVDYLVSAVELLRPIFAQISLEVQPLSVADYQRLLVAGATAVYVYQETYHQSVYKNYHKKGKKAIFDWRLETPDRLGEAGMRKIGLGCLIGLEDWRTDSVFLATHLRYLEKKYWRTRFSVAFPRLRPHTGEFEPKNPQSEKELAQLIWAYRIFDPDLELSLSTRESADFRDSILGLGITHLSAASRTDPGGYTTTDHSLEQFSINDDRSANEVAQAIRAKGYEPVWKDWDAVLES